MLLGLNPPPERLREIIASSAHKAAKWIKSQDGSTWYWPAELAQHADVAKLVGVTEYTKGIAIADDKTD